MCCEAVTNPENLSGYGEHWTWLLLRKVFGTLDKAKTGGMKMVLSELKQNNREVETLGSPVCGSANQ